MSSLDPLEVYGPRPWELLSLAIERGETITKPELLLVIEKYGVPAEKGSYVADRLRERKEGRGRNPEDPRTNMLRAVRAMNLAWEIVVMHAELKRNRKGGRTEALRAVAAAHNMAESTLADHIKKGRRYLPMPTLQSVRRVMRSGAIPPPPPIAGAVAIRMGDIF